MENPFKFGMVVKSEDFCDRNKEMKEISQALRSGMSVSVISPRRYGKTSMIIKLIDDLTEYRKVYIDLMGITTLNDFLDKYVSSIFESLGGIKKFLKDLNNLIKVRSNVALDLGVLKLNFEMSSDSKQDIESVIRLPERFNEKFVIVLDEFQEILNITNVDIIALLRKEFQFFQNVVFIFSGSKRSMMKRIFSNPQKPFYRFTQVYELKNLSKDSVTNFVTQKFEKTGLTIESDTCHEIYQITSGQAYYVQALCYHLWFLAHERGKLNSELLKDALERIMASEKAAYESIWDELNPNQKKILKALSLDKSPYSVKMSAGSVKRSLESLEKSDIIEKNAKYQIIDPIFKIWLMSNR